VNQILEVKLGGLFELEGKKRKKSAYEPHITESSHQIIRIRILVRE
jgi:hypothetical protein